MGRPRMGKGMPLALAWSVALLALAFILPARAGLPETPQPEALHS